MNNAVNTVNRERQINVSSGWSVLPLTAALFLAAPALIIYALVGAANRDIDSTFWIEIGTGILLGIAGIFTSVGYFTLQPNEAQLLMLFGSYRGTVRKSGFHWANPFYSKYRSPHSGPITISPGGTSSAAPMMVLRRSRISLRSRTFNGDRLKVNDKRGNPIEIAAVVIWRVQDTAQAVFDVDDFEKYVATQTESAVRHMASCFAYDQGEDHELTLLNGVTEVSQALKVELQERLSKAGLVVEEARLTHLAYAPEIAQAMLRRQQAEAVIAARQKIVHGAVSMVDMALKELALKQVVHLDDERKAAMVSNLMIVLCGEAEVHPVINTGTLYN